MRTQSSEVLDQEVAYIPLPMAEKGLAVSVSHQQVSCKVPIYGQGGIAMLLDGFLAI